MLGRTKYHNPKAEELIKEGLHKREELLHQGLSYVASETKKDETKRILLQHQKALHNPRSRQSILLSLKNQVHPSSTPALLLSRSSS